MKYQTIESRAKSRSVRIRKLHPDVRSDQTGLQNGRPSLEIGRSLELVPMVRLDWELDQWRGSGVFIRAHGDHARNQVAYWTGKGALDAVGVY